MSLQLFRLPLVFGRWRSGSASSTAGSGGATAQGPLNGNHNAPSLKRDQQCRVEGVMVGEGVVGGGRGSVKLLFEGLVLSLPMLRHRQ